MLSYERNLHEALQHLYDNLADQCVSIDLIQKLAKHLKLDTFVDADVQPKRLSLAGKLLLIEIDFEDDFTVSNVTISLGSEMPEGLQALSGSEISTCILSETTQTDGTIEVKISLENSKSFSLLKSFDSGEPPTAQHVMLKSLQSKKLGTFPANLKYLADLDRFSPHDGDLITYMDRISAYLMVVHHIETSLCPDDSELAQGFSNVYGKLSLGSQEQLLVGAMIQFWQDKHLLEALLDSKSESLYYGLLSVEKSSLETMDYLNSAKRDVWALAAANGITKRYYFTYDKDLLPLVHAGKDSDFENWRLVFELNQPIFISESILDYLGLSDVRIVSDNPMDLYFAAILKSGSLYFEDENGESAYKFEFDDVSNYKAVLAILLHCIGDLARIIPILRSQVVLTSWIRSVKDIPGIQFYENADLESATEASKKLKNSLKLSSDVPDEQLLQLSTMSHDIMGNVNHTNDVGLEEFLSQHDEEMEEANEDLAPVERQKICITVHEPLYEKLCPVTEVDVVGNLKRGTIETVMQLKNGALTRELSSENESELERAFGKALSLCESIPLALQAM